jgi:hypothetical protein
MRVSYAIAFVQFPLLARAGFCPPSGPVFPAPKSLSTNPSFRASLDKLHASLQDVFINGNTSHGPVNNSDTYSVQIFSTKSESPLLEFHHRGTGVVGNRTVDGDSIYRIASTGKLITVFLILLQAGDGILNDPVTRYLPELVGKGHWDDITVGSLAEYMAGIVSDGERLPRCLTRNVLTSQFMEPMVSLVVV